MKKAGKMRYKETKKMRCGLVLITVLWIVMLLGVIVAGSSRSNRLDTKVRLAGIQGLMFEWGCGGGIETAMAVLYEDERGSDGLKDMWAENEDFNDIELEGCFVDVQVVDEAGKLNVNTATRKQLLALPEMTEEIADSIIDWRDKDETPGLSGVEGGYYENLGYGYKIRNGRFGTVRELLLVKGVTSELLYSEGIRWIDYLTCYSFDKNVDADGNDRINVNEADEKKLEKELKIKKSQAKWIVENRGDGKKYKSIADVMGSDKGGKSGNKKSQQGESKSEPVDLNTFCKIADRITVSNEKRIEGRVNINTASRVVLTALLGGGERGEQLADNVMTYRETLPEGMRSIADIINVSSIKTDTLKEIAKHLTTRSDVYSVMSFAVADRERIDSARFMIEAVMDRGSKPARILYWYQGVSN